MAGQKRNNWANMKKCANLYFIPLTNEETSFTVDGLLF